MSATLSDRYLMARGSSAFFNYLHVDLAIAGLAIVFVLIAGLAGNINVSHFIGSAMPDVSMLLPAPQSSTTAERTPLRLSPAMGAALNNVSQRYRVSAEALLPVFEAAQTAGREWRVDPLLIIAVISTESRFNPFSQSPMGALGLMQIIPKYHLEKLPKDAGSRAFLDPVTNVQVGARILQEAIRRQGGLMEGLQYYAGAVDDADQAYANKVVAEKNRLEQTSRRRESGSV